MVRSLSFIHLFVILTVGYIGGALLFRGIQPESIASLLKFYDARVVQGKETNPLWPICSYIVFFALAYGLSISNKTRFLVLFIGAVKAVFFGLSSSYLLSSGMKLMEYSIWWFPFQLLSSFIFLSFCILLEPPYYARPKFGRKLNSRALPTVLFLSIALFVAEMIVFYWLIR